MEVKIFKELTTEAKMIRTKVFMEEQGFQFILCYLNYQNLLLHAEFIIREKDNVM